MEERFSALMNGIEIKIDDLGRLVIPIKYRRKLDLACGDKLLISLNEEGLILTPLEKRCGLCKTKLQGNEKNRAL